MLDFLVNDKTCISCGLCVTDCPAAIIKMQDGLPVIAPADEAKCYKCQHCLAVCPAASISILGVDPHGSKLLSEGIPWPNRLELMIKGRRTVRHYKDENLDPRTITRLVSTAAYAPTGRNTHQVHFTVIDDRKTMIKFREKMMAALVQALRRERFSKDSPFPAIIEQWETRGLDIILRGAPHLVIASASKASITPEADCFIALSTFDLFAQSLGVGTVWAGLLKWTLCDILPELRKELRIPDDDTIGYCLLFGKPAVKYVRTVQRLPAAVNIVGF